MTHSRRTRWALALAEPAGDAAALQPWLALAREREADVLFVLGNLTGPRAEAEPLAEVLRALGESHLPTFLIPGPGDAPVSRYLREAYNIERVFPNVHGVHGTFGFTPNYTLVAGMGGEIVDEATAPRGEVGTLRYPAWEVEYRLRILHELRDYPKIFLFSTPPARQPGSTGRSQALEELIATHRPRLVLVNGPQRDEWLVGTSKIVAVPPLSTSQGLWLDLQELTAESVTVVAPT